MQKTIKFNRVARELFGPESLGGTPTDTLEISANLELSFANLNAKVCFKFLFL